MNKTEMVNAIASEADLTKDQASKALNAVTGGITSALAKGDTVVLPGFGTFSVKDRAERMGRNPSTGAEMKIPASKAPGFKAGKTLKEACNN
jgi:DNA-binding protein HU-beta